MLGLVGPREEGWVSLTPWQVSPPRRHSPYRCSGAWSGSCRTSPPRQISCIWALKYWNLYLWPEILKFIFWPCNIEIYIWALKYWNLYLDPEILKFIFWPWNIKIYLRALEYSNILGPWNIQIQVRALL